MSQPEVQNQMLKIKIEVTREKCPELYRFTDLYITPRRFMTWAEYQRLIGRWEFNLIEVLRGMCENVFDLDEGEECPVDTEKMWNEIFDVLESNEEFKKMEKELGIEWGEIEEMDVDIHVDDKIEISPILEFKGNDYKIYLVITTLNG